MSLAQARTRALRAKHAQSAAIIKVEKYKTEVSQDGFPKPIGNCHYDSSESYGRIGRQHESRVKVVAHVKLGETGKGENPNPVPSCRCKALQGPGLQKA